MSNTDKNLLLKPVGKDGRQVNVAVDGGSHIYTGAMVAQLTATGMLVPGSTASSGHCVGVAQHESNNAGSDGDTTCRVESERIYVFENDVSNAADESTLLGSPLFMVDDHTVGTSDVGGTLQRAGYFVGMEPDGGVRVLITLTAAPATAADVGALTFTAVAGTANTTLEAMADPTDTPANADALRDDIVANLLPKIRNNFADVATQINAIRTALQAAGLMA